MQWRITNLRAQKFPPPPKLHLSKAPTKWPPTSPCRRPQQVFPAAFLTLAIFKETYRSFSARRAASLTNSDLYFQYFVLDLYILQFNFCFLSDFLFHGKLHLIQVWQWRDFSKPIRTSCQSKGTNEIASFWKDNRWRQIAIFVFVEAGKGSTFRITWNDFEINQLLRRVKILCLTLTLDNVKSNVNKNSKTFRPNNFGLHRIF